MKDKSTLILIHKILKATADSTIKVFIPLYILKQTGNVNLSLLYLVVYALSTFLMNIALKKVLCRFGTITIIIHFIPIIIAEGLLSFLTIGPGLTIIAAVLMSVNQACYSVPINLVLALGDKNVNVSKFEIGTNIGRLIFTAVSGILLASFESSFLILSIVSSVIYIASSVPILFSYNLFKDEYARNIKEHTSAVRLPLIYDIFHIAFGSFQVVITDIVPLWLYINNLSFTAVALIIALIELLKILANYLAKKIPEKYMLLTCAVSVVIYIASIIIILTVKNAVALYITSCVCSVSFPFVFVPIFRYFISKSKANGSLFNDMSSRDTDIFSVRPFLFASGFLPCGLISCFVFGMAASVVMLLAERKILK